MLQQKTFHEVVFETTRRWTPLSFKTGKLAPHCDGAVEITMGETTLLVTAVLNKHPDPDKDFLPLAIDYRESRYAAGKIAGGRYRKREGRPSDEAALYARLTDRPMRPMFPKGMVNDVVITISPLSLDQKHSPGELSIIGSSLAVMLAGIPFEGPVSAVRVWYKNGEYIVNMTEDQLGDSIMDLHVAGTRELINMIEAGGTETPMDVVKKWFEVAQDALRELCDFQQEFLKLCTIKPKTITTNTITDAMLEEIHEVVTDDHLQALVDADKEKAAFDELYYSYERLLEDSFTDHVDNKESPRTKRKLASGLFQLFKKYVRASSLGAGIRIDGRKDTEIRSLYCEIDVVPRVHGTGLFRRGDTQVLSLLTLWSPGDAELKDGMEHDDVETRFMHHYKMPPFSNNEAEMIRGTNRREVGHGRLAEKALEAVLPPETDFPYTMRIVSEVLGSGGSTSMASVCGSTLALMAGWVPITKPVSGIAMGLIQQDAKHVILSDIKGTEDFIGDMDFKLAGTDDGMTAIQMDIKLHGLHSDLLQTIVDRAQVGRTSILEFMMQTITTPKWSISPYAPFLMKFSVKPEQVREVIGPGGSVITEIVRLTNVKIDLEDDGTGVITAKNEAAAQEAFKLIQGAIRSPKRGDVITGTIMRVEKYGVFVDLGKKKSGLCHVKNLWEGFIEDPATKYNKGEQMTVEIIDIDSDGKIQLKKVA